MANTDKLRKASNGSGRPVVTSLALPKTAGTTTAEITSATNWNTTTGVDVVMYRRQLNSTTGKYEQVAGTQTDWVGQLTGTTLSGLTLRAGTEPASGYAADGNTVVFCGPTGAWGDDLVAALLTSHDETGALLPAAVSAALGVSNTANSGWNPVGQVPVYASNNGNKEFTCTVPADLRSTLSVGMKVKFDRGTTAPTQCMSFTAASSQYASKSSPTGITFTSAFTCEAWVYLNSYTGNNQFVVSRTDNSTGGFMLRINPSGQVECLYGASSAFTAFTSYQSVPLNRWVHVAVSVTSVASKTGVVYINGTVVPSNSNLTASATTLTQTGNVSVGAAGAGVANTFFNGQISESRIWSAAQTQANIQANMAISLTGSETNLVGLWQGNGNFNDKTTNANNLTATGGAIATQSANPYSNTEYGIITKLSYTAPNTTITVFTGTDYNIPNMALTNFNYSQVRVPYGFPASRGKWLHTLNCESNTIAASIATANTWATSNLSTTVPTGEWRVNQNILVQISSGSSAQDAKIVLYPGTPVNGNYSYDGTAMIYSGVGTSGVLSQTATSYPASVPSPTTYTLYAAQSITGSSPVMQIRGDLGTALIEFECAYI